MVVIESLLVILLLIIFIQDLRYQAVSWIFFPVGFLFMGILSFYNGIRSDLIFNSVINTAFVLFQLGIIYLFTWIRFKERKNIFKSSFGLGDFLFLIMIIPMFSPVNYILFFLTSIIFSLILFMLLRVLNLYKKEKVPLAGFQSLFLIVVIGMQTLVQFNFYDDFLIIDKLNIL